MDTHSPGLRQRSDRSKDKTADPGVADGFARSGVSPAAVGHAPPGRRFSSRRSLCAAVLRFPASWTTAFEVGASFITLMMLVVIQHTPKPSADCNSKKTRRTSAGTSREAESMLIMLEEESSETMQAVEDK